MIYDDKVYEFEGKFFAERPNMFIKTPGVRIDSYFEGAFLKNKATVLYAYGLSNETTKIFFMASHRYLVDEHNEEEEYYSIFSVN